MKNPRSEEEKIIKDGRKPFRLKKKIKGVKDIVLKNIKDLFEYKKEEENYYQPVKVNNFITNYYIEYKSNGDKNRILSAEEHQIDHRTIRPYLRDIMNDLRHIENSINNNN